ncbi:MAG: hypothetical protein AAFW98_13030, partial [Pseudomonadota bacterium]
MTSDQDARSQAIARFGTDEPGPEERKLEAGGLEVTLVGGVARWIVYRGAEVVRGIDYLVRDGNWGTLATRTTSEEFSEVDGFRYRRRFDVGDAFQGAFELVGNAGTPAKLDAKLTLTAVRDVSVNRAGFVLLHPLKGVVGAPLDVTHSDGSQERASFPRAISPGQPVFDIAGLSHSMDGAKVEIAFAGDVFEMEDQRNWSDASFKTYCRPLGLPRPFVVTKGDVIEQQITVRVSGAGAAAAARGGADGIGTAPAISLALDDEIAVPDERTVAALSSIAYGGVSVRLSAGTARGALGTAKAFNVPIDLEVVVPDGDDLRDALASVGRICAGDGVVPRRVMALPAPYMASIQPEGPWPSPTPGDAAEAARNAFPSARIGGGVLTNFTELNRCRPNYDSDFVTFGNTAIVHAADDASVLETLEAIP